MAPFTVDMGLFVRCLFAKSGYYLIKYPAIRGGMVSGGVWHGVAGKRVRVRRGLGDGAGYGVRVTIGYGTLFFMGSERGWKGGRVNPPTRKMGAEWGGGGVLSPLEKNPTPHPNFLTNPPPKLSNPP